MGAAYDPEEILKAAREVGAALGIEPRSTGGAASFGRGGGGDAGKGWPPIAFPFPVPEVRQGTAQALLAAIVAHPGGDAAVGDDGRWLDRSASLPPLARVCRELQLSADYFALAVAAADWSAAHAHVRDQADPARALGRAWGRLPGRRLRNYQRARRC